MSTVALEGMCVWDNGDFGVKHVYVSCYTLHEDTTPLTLRACRISHYNHHFKRACVPSRQGCVYIWTLERSIER